MPIDLRLQFGKKEVKYSLKTKDQAEAKLLVRQASVEFVRKCEAYRKGVVSNDEPIRNLVLNEESIQRICEKWKYLMLEGDERMRMSDLPDSEHQEQMAIRHRGYWLHFGKQFERVWSY
ncbi:MAG: hypothetical protein A2V90_06035 [Gammaproteobacteria bacterium RBG_16_57_12]|nr:MAG: hypothetical protein A2V90_06035 [Gammaproteobacteria bacterium RBG_16_57_12]